MMSWWRDLEPREKALIYIALSLTLVLGILQFVLRPALAAHARAERAYERMVTLETDVATGLQRLATLRPASGEGAAADPDAGLSLERVVSGAAEEAGLQIIRLQPGEDRLQVWLDDVDSRLVMNWIRQMENRPGLVVEDVSLTRRDSLGSVRVNMTFARRGP